MKIGIIGGGISGIASALHLHKKSPNKKTIIKIMESSERLGGRVFVKTVPKNGMEYQFDVGANLIDFNEQQLIKWKQLLPEHIQNNLKPFTRPFLMLEKGKISEGDLKSHPKFYYQEGFQKFINDLKQELKGVDIHLNQKVEKIQIQQNLVNVQTNNGLQTDFDSVIFAVPSPNVCQILDKLQSKGENNLEHLASQIQYTKQISVAFISPDSQAHPFSCVLLKDHPVGTFICSHQQKYGQSSMVVQLTEAFSDKYMEESDQNIHKLVYKSLLQTLPQVITSRISEQFVLVHKWHISLVKPNLKPSRPEVDPKIQFVGDWVEGKSRVSGALGSVFGLQWYQESKI